jgi:hypothetical protein
LYEDKDMFEHFIKCLQCGYYLTPQGPGPVSIEATQPVEADGVEYEALPAIAAPFRMMHFG